MKAETVEAVRQTARKIMREYSREDIFQIADLMTTGIIAALAATPEHKALVADAERYLAAIRGLAAVEALINESQGVSGLHLNGDIAAWNDLRTGGRFEAWLIDFDAAIDAARGGEG